MKTRRLNRILAFLLLTPAARGSGFYLIVHMTNTPATVQWAVDQGANGLEMDLRFDDAGNPTVFQHGGAVTDCACAFSYGICKIFDGDPKTRNTPAGQHLDNIATKAGIALVVIDSKIDGAAEPAAKQSAAGKAAVKLLEDHLFRGSYAGQVIVSTASTAAAAYLSAVAVAAAASPFKNRIHFTFDQEGSDVAKSVTALIGYPNPNRVYGTGISACSPTQYYGAVERAVRNRNAGVVGFAYTWTLDAASSITQYVQRGIDGIITNDPTTLKGVLAGKGIALAKPNDSIPAATTSNIVP
jgi:hypothetical protein